MSKKRTAFARHKIIKRKNSRNENVVISINLDKYKPNETLLLIPVLSFYFAL